MRIGFDAKRMFGNYSGLGNYSRTLVTNLVKFYPDNDYFLYSPKIRNPVRSSINNSGENVHESIYQGKFRSWWRSYGIIKNLTKDRIELYHGLSHEIPFNAHNQGIKWVVTIHDLIIKTHPELFPFIDRTIYEQKIKNSCKKADKIIAISENTKRDLIAYYGIDETKIKVVYQSCLPLYYSRQSPEIEKEVLSLYNVPEEYFLFIGGTQKRKNLQLVISAYSELPSSYKIPLVIVGKMDRNSQQLLEMIRNSGMEKGVTWIHDLESNIHLQAIYQKAQALIYPSIYEGFGLPVVEALLSKTPVITSDTSSLKEAGGPSSLYIDPLEAGELAVEISKVLTDTENRESMIQEGYSYAQKQFNPEKTTKDMISAYKNILNA